MKNKNIKTFRIEVEGDDGEMYEGQFSCKKLSILDNSRINRRRSELGGGMYCVVDENGNPTGQGIDSTTETMNYATAVCEVGLLSKPEWFDLEELSEVKVLIAVFEEVMAYQNSFRGRAGKTSEGNGSSESGQRSGGKKQEEANSGNNPKKVVDKEVSTAMDA